MLLQKQRLTTRRNPSNVSWMPTRIQQKVLDLLNAGHTQMYAALECNCAQSTVNAWARKFGALRMPPGRRRKQQ